MPGITYSLGFTTAGLSKGFGAVQGFASRISATFASVAMRVNGLFAAVGGLGGLLKEAVSSAADMESTEVAFETLIGRAGLAKRTLADLKRFADTTPFEFPEIAEAAKSLLAMGSDASEVTQELRMLGDVGSLLNQPLGELAYIFGQARTSGRLMAQDVNQLVGRGVPVIQEFAKQFGVGTGEVRNLVEDGKIGFDNLRRALVSLTSEGGRFFQGMEKQSKTAMGMWSTFTDSVKGLLREFGKPLLPELKRILQAATDLTGKLVEKARQWGQAVASVMGVIRELLASGKLMQAIGDGLKIALGGAVNFFVKSMIAAAAAVGVVLMKSVKDALGMGGSGTMADTLKEAAETWKKAYAATPDVVGTSGAQQRFDATVGPALAKVRVGQIGDMVKGVAQQIAEAFSFQGVKASVPNPVDKAGSSMETGVKATDRLAQIGGFIGLRKETDRAQTRRLEAIHKTLQVIEKNTAKNSVGGAGF
jgi:tape measure domain-containing protein